MILGGPSAGAWDCFHPGYRSAPTLWEWYNFKTSTMSARQARQGAGCVPAGARHRGENPVPAHRLRRRSVARRLAGRGAGADFGAALSYWPVRERPGLVEKLDRCSPRGLWIGLARRAYGSRRPPARCAGPARGGATALDFALRSPWMRQERRIIGMYRDLGLWTGRGDAARLDGRDPRSVDLWLEVADSARKAGQAWRRSGSSRPPRRCSWTRRGRAA